MDAQGVTNLNHVRLLLVEDDLTDQLGFKRFVKKQGLSYDYDISGSVTEALTLLSSNDYDVVIADHALGDGTAFDLFEYIPDTTAVIFVTGNDNTNIAVKALKTGASDYLSKDIDGHYLELLPHIIDAVLKSKADEIELDKHRNHLEKMVLERTIELHQEIEQRKLIEQQLRLLAVAFETHEAIVITDAQAIVLRVNQAFTSLTGYTAEEMLGKNMSVLNSGLQNSGFYSQLWRELIATGRFEGEVWNSRKSGEVYPEWLTITAILDDNGKTTHYVGNLADISKQKKAEAEIKKLAFYDSLTGLANRRLLLDRIDQECAVAKRNTCFGAIVFIDLDDFKPLNDTYGHNVGDELLIQLAKRLMHSLREEDTAARLGGDEFVVLIHANEKSFETALLNAKTVAAKIQTELNLAYSLNGLQHIFTSSIGITVFPKDVSGAENIINQADQAMYQSKKKGKNSICVFPK